MPRTPTQPNVASERVKHDARAELLARLLRNPGRERIDQLPVEKHHFERHHEHLDEQHLDEVFVLVVLHRVGEHLNAGEAAHDQQARGTGRESFRS